VTYLDRPMRNEPNRRIKILAVPGSMEIGGAQKQFVSLARLLNRDKFDLFTAVHSASGPCLKEYPKDIPVHDLGATPGRGNSPRLIRGIRHLILHIRPDILYTLLWGSNVRAALANRLVPANIRPKHVILIQNNPESYGTHGLLLLKLLCPWTDVVCSVSEGVQRGLLRHINISGEKLRVIYDGVDIGEIRHLSNKPVEHKWIASEVPLLICVSRLVRQKGLPYLLEAFRLVNHEMPCHLIIIGDGPERQNLEQLATELGIRDRVDFLGFQTNPFPYIARADVFVLASLWEGFGIVLIEAMALGTPVVATRAPYGPEEIIEDGVDGLLVPVKNPPAMSRSIVKLLSDPSLRAQLAERGRETVERKFSAKARVHRLEQLFYELFAEQGEL